jgi:hypothetical protein
MNAQQLSNLLDSLDVVRTQFGSSRQTLAIDSTLLERVESELPVHRCDYCGTSLRGDSLSLPCPSCGASYDGTPPDSEPPLQCSEPSRPDHTEGIAIVWEWLEPELRSWGAVQSDRVDAWLSDCAVIVCESDEATLIEFLDCVEAGKLTPPLRKRMMDCAFQRRVKGHDVGEEQQFGEVRKSLTMVQRQSEEFWDEVPQHEQPEKDPGEASRIFQHCLADWAEVDSDSMLRSIIAICEVPDFTGLEQAKSAKMSKATHYRNLAKLRTRLSCFGLMELAATL